jgi:cytochrome c peroxidase
MKRWIIYITPVLTGFIFIQATFDMTKDNISSKASLGKKLFNEKLLSKDSSISCASCHKPNHAFADTLPFSIGIHGKLTKRNTPSVLNMKNRPYYFWDGRVGSLEEQALIPIKNPDEMGLPINEAVKRLNENPEYYALFLKIFKERPSKENLSGAIAAYENTLETADSKFDDWSNHKVKLNPEEEAGRKLFIGDKAKCFNCHSTGDFTDDGYKNIGLYDGNTLNDAGHYDFSKKESDRGRFKTPGLRNVAVTAPYMHNGMFKTLEEVVEHYNNPAQFVQHPLNMDPAFKEPLRLSEQEKQELVAFLKTLTDKAYLPK